jgi:hypothetical protein
MMSEHFNRSSQQSDSHTHDSAYSIIAGGLLLISYVTRDTTEIALTIYLEVGPRRSYGRRAQRAVMKSIVSTARSAITYA